MNGVICMTEKRFKEIVSTETVIDNHTGKEYKCILDNDLFDLINTIAEENEQLKQDKKRLIGYLHRYGKVDVEDIDEVVLNQEYLDEWGELYGGDME